MVAVSNPRPEKISLNQEWVISGRLVDGVDPKPFTLSPLPFFVGRRSGLSLTLPKATVSSVHAEFFAAGRKLIIRDLQSTNGTFLRIEGENEVVLKREEIILRGQGTIGFGHSALEQGIDLMSFEVLE